jgi:hypothetical protein
LAAKVISKQGLAYHFIFIFALLKKQIHELVYQKNAGHYYEVQGKKRHS